MIKADVVESQTVNSTGAVERYFRKFFITILFLKVLVYF